MIAAHLKTLEQKHAQLENAIRTELLRPSCDAQMIRRMKGQKLRLKEEIEKLKERDSPLN